MLNPTGAYIWVVHFSASDILKQQQDLSNVINDSIDWVILPLNLRKPNLCLW